MLINKSFSCFSCSIKADVLSFSFGVGVEIGFDRVAAPGDAILKLIRIEKLRFRSEYLSLLVFEQLV